MHTHSAFTILKYMDYKCAQIATLVNLHFKHYDDTGLSKGTGQTCLVQGTGPRQMIGGGGEVATPPDPTCAHPTERRGVFLSTLIHFNLCRN